MEPFARSLDLFLRQPSFTECTLRKNFYYIQPKQEPALLKHPVDFVWALRSA